MIDPDLKKQLDTISANLVEVRRSFRITAAFWRGILGGVGSVIGAALAIVVIGWILNTIGIIPAFKQQADLWRQTLDKVSNTR